LEDGTVSAIDAMMTKFPSDGFYILQGEVAVNRRVDTKSYTSLHALVHGMFPPMTSFEQVQFRVPFLLYDLHNYGAIVHTKLISQTLSFVLMGYFCTSVAIGGVAKFS
jgi:hypothetical protein